MSLAAIMAALTPMLNAHLLEVGPAGYDTWQITGDSRSAASTTRDQVHAVGGQLGLTYLPWVLSVNLHGFYEYFATERLPSTGLPILELSNPQRRWVAQPLNLHLHLDLAARHRYADRTCRFLYQTVQ